MPRGIPAAVDPGSTKAPAAEMVANAPRTGASSMRSSRPTQPVPLGLPPEPRPDSPPDAPDPSLADGVVGSGAM